MYPLQNKTSPPLGANAQIPLITIRLMSLREKKKGFSTLDRSSYLTAAFPLCFCFLLQCRQGAVPSAPTSTHFIVKFSLSLCVCASVRNRYGVYSEDVVGGAPWTAHSSRTAVPALRERLGVCVSSSVYDYVLMLKKIISLHVLYFPVLLPIVVQ